MRLAKLGKKGQLTIPRALLRAVGIADESRVVLESIKLEANKRDVPYQSLIRVWLAEKVAKS